MLLEEEGILGRDRMSKEDREWLNANLHLVHVPMTRDRPRNPLSVDIQTKETRWGVDSRQRAAGSGQRTEDRR